MPWEYRGITGAGKKPGPVGQSSGICVVLGGGRCVWDDITKLWRMMGFTFRNSKDDEPPWTTIAVNDIACHYKPKLDHIASLHEAQLYPSVLIRHENACHYSVPLTHTQRHGVDRPGPALYAWDLQGYVGGTSAGFAAAIAIAMGHSKVVLAGVPLDGNGHYFDPPFAKLTQFDTRTQDIQWSAFRDYFGDVVRSMSGKTAKILSKPTEEWLIGEKVREVSYGF